MPPLVRPAILALVFAAALSAQSVTVLVLRFQNNSTYSELNWVGESIAETLRADYAQTNEIVIGREAALEGMKKLDLRPEANFTKATIIHLSQALEADMVVYGGYDIKLPSGVSDLKQGEIVIDSQIIDLRKFQNAPGVSETGKLSDLSKNKEYLAWQTLAYLDHAHQPATFEQFMAGRKPPRMEAEESYVHGLLSTDKEQQKKWLLQAANLDPQFISPDYQLGMLYLDQNDPKQAAKWLQRVPASDARYLEARFRLGVAAYLDRDYSSAVAYFREVSKVMPLHEVFNNLGAAEDQLNLPAAIDDFRRAVDSDPSDTAYLFNLGAALLRRNLFDEAQRDLQTVMDRSPDDGEADDLLAQAEDRKISAPGAKPLAPARIKLSMDSTAFRQLKAMLQPGAAK